MNNETGTYSARPLIIDIVKNDLVYSKFRFIKFNPIYTNEIIPRIIAATNLPFDPYLLSLYIRTDINDPTSIISPINKDTAIERTKNMKNIFFIVKI